VPTQGGFIRAKKFGLKGDGTLESTTRVNALLDYLANNTNKERIVFWPPGNYLLPPIQINSRGIRFWGEQKYEFHPTLDTGGTQFNFSLAAGQAGIQLGTDSGLPRDQNQYDGIS
jgi:hypothetical protein